MASSEGAWQLHGQLHLQVPKRAYTLEELRLNKIQPERFLSPTDNTLSGVRNVLQVRGVSCGFEILGTGFGIAT